MNSQEGAAPRQNSLTVDSNPDKYNIFDSA